MPGYFSLFLFLTCLLQAAGAIIFLTIINILGVRWGAILQRGITGMNHITRHTPQRRKHNRYLPPSPKPTLCLYLTVSFSLLFSLRCSNENADNCARSSDGPVLGFV
jgi:hypothetical protein